jgi:cytochrome oxidase Cu insertion factor (SCO1/SenC/PrrC family)
VRRRGRWPRALGLLVAVAAAAAGARGLEEPALFELPAVGSYELPPIQRVQEHWLLDPRRERAPVLGLAPGELAVVSFVYRSCSAAAGCPLALAVLRNANAAVAEDPALAPRVRFVSVSFDPQRDTPERMAELEASLAPRAPWRFLTAAGAAELAPVLADYGQDVAAEVDEHGAESGILRHVLKVFLVDSTGAVRNVYSAGFLSAEILLLDLRTLASAGGDGVRGSD